MGKGVGESPAGAAPMDVFAQAEALNAVSKTYDVEIDGVPLQRMSTVELSKLAASRGLPPSHARGELIGAIARDELDARERRGAGSTNSRADDLRDVDVPDGQPRDDRAVDALDDDAASVDAPPSSYVVGSASVVWEGELYTYGGLTPDGEFVSAITRWSGRGQTSEVNASASDPKRGVPPGRYGHSAVVVDDQLLVFGGQSAFGSLDDLWRFDFVACEWTLEDVGAESGAPPPARTGHCACVSDDVMFVFGGKDVQPGKDEQRIYNDLYGFDLNQREWLAIDTRWRRPAGGDGCAMTSVNGVLYVLSPSDTMMEMLVWCLQLSAKGALRWTQAPRSGRPPSPRTDYVSAVHGANWIIHGGRVLLRDGALGDAYAFHFPTAEWGKFDPESDTDPRFQHCGCAVDGALVLLHGARGETFASKRDEDALEDDDDSAPPRADDAVDVGPCIAIDLGSYLMFPEHDETKRPGEAEAYEFDAREHGHPSTAEERRAAAEAERERTRNAEAEPGDDAAATTEAEAEAALLAAREEANLAAFEAEGFPRMSAKLLGKLNKRGVGEKGGLMGGSLHVGRIGAHAPGDVELVAGKVKLHAHRDVLAAASPRLARLMATRPAWSAMARQPDVVEHAFRVHPFFGQLLGLLAHLLHVVFVAVSFAVRGAVRAGTGDGKRVTLVFDDASVPILVAMLRWMYRIPLHPPAESLAELHDAGVRYEIRGLGSYCRQRMQTEMCPALAAGGARIGKERKHAGLWKAAVRCAKRDWDAVAASAGMDELATTHPEVAKQFALEAHDGIDVEE